LRHHPLSARPRKGFALVVLGAEPNGQLDELDAVVVDGAMPDWDIVAEGGKTVVVDREDVAAELLACAAQLGLKCRGIVASGGQMASHLVDALGAQRLAVAAEVAPLCARGTLFGGEWAGLPVITQGGLDGRLRTLVNDLWRD
jgi:uncharacterized protein YgbK (DUF1537 family)